MFKSWTTTSEKFPTEDEANNKPLALTLPEAVKCVVKVKEPVIAASPFLCPVDLNVFVDIVSVKAPEISDAIWAEEDNIPLPDK